MLALWLIAVFTYLLVGLISVLFWRQRIEDLITELTVRQGSTVGMPFYGAWASILIMWPLAWLVFGARAYWEFRQRNQQMR